MTSHRQCSRPRLSVDPIYMPGRLRTASRPSSTDRWRAVYASPPPCWPGNAVATVGAVTEHLPPNAGNPGGRPPGLALCRGTGPPAGTTLSLTPPARWCAQARRPTLPVPPHATWDNAHIGVMATGAGKYPRELRKGSWSTNGEHDWQKADGRF